MEGADNARNRCDQNQYSGQHSDALAIEKLAGPIPRGCRLRLNRARVEIGFQILAKFARAGIAPGGIVFERLGGDDFEVTGELALEIDERRSAQGCVVGVGCLPQRRSFGILIGARQLLHHLARVAEGALPAEQFIENHAQRVDIAASGDCVLAQLLGAGVAGREQHQLGDGLLVGPLH